MRGYRNLKKQGKVTGATSTKISKQHSLLHSEKHQQTLAQQSLDLAVFITSQRRVKISTCECCCLFFELLWVSPSLGFVELRSKMHQLTIIIINCQLVNVVVTSLKFFKFFAIFGISGICSVLKCNCPQPCNAMWNAQSCISINLTQFLWNTSTVLFEKKFPESKVSSEVFKKVVRVLGWKTGKSSKWAAKKRRDGHATDCNLQLLWENKQRTMTKA